MNAIKRAVEAAGGPSKVAKALGITPQAVCFYRNGKRELPAHHAAPLEQATGYLVRRWDMYPDTWQRIWPELVGADGAPPIAINREPAHAI